VQQRHSGPEEPKTEEQLRKLARLASGQQQAASDDGGDEQHRDHRVGCEHPHTLFPSRRAHRRFRDPA
jgi:hypothetical protein